MQWSKTNYIFLHKIGNFKVAEEYYLKGLNLNDQEILTKVASESGIDPNDFAEGISSDEIKDELKVNMDAFPCFSIFS